jgi:hypothetical protein
MQICGCLVFFYITEIMELTTNSREADTDSDSDPDPDLTTDY